MKNARHGLELTYRGVFLGGIITLIFTAANVFLGLKVGLTFASSIPAAVISMAILRGFRNSSIFENNIVQTIASSAGTLSSIIFVLPGLVMIGWWTGFPFWESFTICTVGGILGVMFTIPLRRALVTGSDLPYPEGVACAEILIVGDTSREGQEEDHRGLIAVIGGAIASAAFAVVVATRLFIDEADAFFRIGPSSTGIGFGLSLALVGAGHLIGLSVGIAMLVGLIISWGAAVPILTAMHVTTGSPFDIAMASWSHQVRFIGSGTIGIAAIWTLGKLALPVWRGLLASIAASRARGSGDDARPRTERDMPIALVAAISLACLVPLTVLLVIFGHQAHLGSLVLPLTLLSVAYVVVVGFLVAAVCGYMAGLIGSSNSPVSGLAILAVLGISLIVVAVSHSLAPEMKPALLAFALFVTAVVLCVATIANDNLQDLKTGQLVDATPWRQQVALVIGVVFGALVIPPVLNLLNSAYGFAGSPIVHLGAKALPAPQATLITALARGVIGGKLDWSLIGVGALIGIGIIALDEFLGATKKMRLPPLAIGLGIYLPAATTAPVIFGAVVGHFYNRWAKTQKNTAAAERYGVLMASGLIVGESLIGIVIAGIIIVTKNPAPLALIGGNLTTITTIIGAIAFAATTFGLYSWVKRLSTS